MLPGLDEALYREIPESGPERDEALAAAEEAKYQLLRSEPEDYLQDALEFWRGSEAWGVLMDALKLRMHAQAGHILAGMYADYCEMKAREWAEERLG